jgi:hypothetical protein
MLKEPIEVGMSGPLSLKKRSGAARQEALRYRKRFLSLEVPALAHSPSLQPGTMVKPRL